MRNCTFADNYTVGGEGGYGGAGAYEAPNGPGGSGGTAYAQMFGTNQILTNCTLAWNLTVGGRGGSGSSTGTNGQALGGLVTGAALLNCLLASNSPANASGWVTNQGHNLSTESGCFTNATSLNSVDARLAGLASNGGPTMTAALLPGSPAIDAADTQKSSSLDQRGLPRPVGVAVDIGAYDFGSPAYLQASRGLNGLSVLAVGVPYQFVVLQASTNLANWVPVVTNRLSSSGRGLSKMLPVKHRNFLRLRLP